MKIPRFVRSTARYLLNVFSTAVLIFLFSDCRLLDPPAWNTTANYDNLLANILDDGKPTDVIEILEEKTYPRIVFEGPGHYWHVRVPGNAEEMLSRKIQKFSLDDEFPYLRDMFEREFPGTTGLPDKGSAYKWDLNESGRHYRISCITGAKTNELYITAVRF